MNKEKILKRVIAELKKKTVKMKVHAGGGWEGHVVFTAINPDNPEDQSMSSNLEEVKQFCKKRNLEEDKEFESLVKKHLSYEQGTGLVIPTKEIDEHKPVSSASAYLKKHFSRYY